MLALLPAARVSIFALVYVGIHQFFIGVGAVEVTYDPTRCVPNNPRYIEWVEDYKLETDEMEQRCLTDIQNLHKSLIGQHGPPLEIEIKDAVCFGACQQYIANIDYLLETSGCPCNKMDEVFPLSGLDHELESWCQRRPTQMLAEETGIIAEWHKFNARYCECSIAIACDSSRARSFGFLASSFAVAVLWHRFA